MKSIMKKMMSSMWNFPMFLSFLLVNLVLVFAGVNLFLLPDMYVVAYSVFIAYMFTSLYELESYQDRLRIYQY